MKLTRVNVAAGAFAFRWFLSIFPIIIALLGVGGLVTLPQRFVVSLIQGVSKSLPSGAAQVFSEAITNATHHSSADLPATIVASIVALWSATSGMVIVEEGLDMAYDIERDRSFIAKRVVAIPLLLGATVLGGAASSLVIFGARLDQLINGALPAGSALIFLWSVIRWVLALALMNLLFSLLYYVAPNRAKSKWKWTSAGSFVATLMWAVVSLGFSLYTADFGSYAKTYGAFAGVAILIFWLYLTGLALLIGGEINAASERRQKLVLHDAPHQLTPNETAEENKAPTP
ncbi:MAG TPA: YihY/virulence factor BrkB family protein [Acidimicrobiales bacterium]|nr:YihY/virulence factor BrkB family protein [Acidimicrobiales bacterium]